MPTLDRRQKSGPRVKAVKQYQGKRLEYRFPDASPKSWRQARKKEDELLEKLKKMYEMSMASSISRFTTFLVSSKYLDHSKVHHSTKTYKEKKAALQAVIKHFGKDREIDTITPAEVSEFFNKLAKKKSGYAINKIRKNVNACWKHSITFIDGFPQTRCPFEAVPKMAEVRTERYVPPKEDYEKVLKIVKGQDFVMLKTFYLTGARRNEIYSLRWSDIDFDQKRIRLWTKKRKGGNKEFDLIPMFTELKELLLDWKDKQPIKSDFVFVNDVPQSKGYGEPYKDRIRFMHKICEEAEVTFFGYHSIRHLTATMLYHAGHPISVIQRILRHKNPNTTVRYLRELGLDRALDAIDGTI